MADSTQVEELEGAAGGFDETPALHKLPPRRQRFVEEYLVDLNAHAAAERAGYAPGEGAYVEGKRLLRNALVRAAVDEGLASMRANRQAQAERIRRELELIAYADIGDAVTTDEHGRVRVLNLQDIDPKVRRTISKISQTSTERTEMGASRDDAPTIVEKVQTTVEYHSKLQALKMLSELEGFAKPQRVEHTGKDGGPIRTDNKNANTHGLSEATRRAILKDVVGIPEPVLEAGAQAGEVDMSTPDSGESAG